MFPPSDSITTLLISAHQDEVRRVAAAAHLARLARLARSRPVDAYTLPRIARRIWRGPRPERGASVA